MSPSRVWEMSAQRSSINRTRRPNRGEGFTLVEVLVSMAVLAVGLLSVAALIAGTIQAGTRAKYMSMASILASEKLDSLSKWPSADTPQSTSTAMSTAPTDPNIWPGGTLNFNGSNVCAANDQYCDQVTVSESSGADYETQQQVVNGVTQQTTIVHTSSGCVGTPTACGVPAPTAGAGSTFIRRWQITKDPPISAVGGGATNATGTRRITVAVKLTDTSAKNPLQFQLSMVRP
jgi:type IV pilus modification protein PilV